MILLVFWLIAYACTILVLIFGVQRLRVGNETKKTLSIDEVTIVIPFRNEAKNLQQLIDCIRRQSYQPNQWIFVNDHSEDDFRSAFDEVKNFPIRVLNLPDEQDGKKAALRFGMDHSTSNYTLTLDADVQFGKDFIKSLLVMPEMDMLILPVEMVGKKWWQEFFNLEYRLTHILNKGISGWFRPINASGANLLIGLFLKFTTMKIFTILSVLAFLLSCASSKETANNSISKIEYGTSYGNCMGYCWNQYTLDGKTITENRKATGRGDRSKYPEVNTPKDLKSSDWEAILKTIDQQKMLEMAETIGCPDCADGGAEWIAVYFTDGTSKKVTIEAYKDIEGIQDAMKLLRKSAETYFPKKI